MAALSLVVTILTQVAVDGLQLRASHLHASLLEILSQAGIELQQARKILDASGLEWPDAGNRSGTNGATAAGGAYFSQTFDAAMRKASERFTVSSRLIAAGISVVVAFGLPLDMLDLFRTFSSGAGALIFPANAGAMAGTVARGEPRGRRGERGAAIARRTVLVRGAERSAEAEGSAGVMGNLTNISVNTPAVHQTVQRAVQWVGCRRKELSSTGRPEGSGPRRS